MESSGVLYWVAVFNVTAIPIHVPSVQNDVRIMLFMNNGSFDRYGGKSLVD